MQTRKKNSTVGKMFTKKSIEAKDALKKEISNDEHVEPLDEINVKENNMLILDENLFEDYGVQERHSMNEDTEDDERVKTFKLNGIIYKISKLEDSLGNGGYVARWEDDSDNGLGYNNRGWISFDKKSYVLHNEASKPIKDFMYVISAYDRQPKQSAADKLIATTISMFDDAEIYAMTPDDPHYLNEAEEKLTTYYQIWAKGPSDSKFHFQDEYAYLSDLVEEAKGFMHGDAQVRVLEVEEDKSGNIVKRNGEVLFYSDGAVQTVDKELFDVATPQETADMFGKKVYSKKENKLYYSLLN